MTELNWTLLGFFSETEPIGFIYMWEKFYCKILAQATMEAGKSSIFSLETREIPWYRWSLKAFHWRIPSCSDHCRCSIIKSWVTLGPYKLQHARLPCTSLFPRVFLNSCPLSWWYHPTISSSVTPFSFRPQSSPASGSFPVSWRFDSGWWVFLFYLQLQLIG